MYVLLFMLLFAVFVFLLGKLILVYATKLTSVFIDTNHKYADEVITTGYVPVDWLVNTRASRPRIRSRMNKRKALRGLGKIIRYFRRTPMVASEEERARILGRLRSVKDHWRDAAWEQIVPPNLLD